MHVNFTPLIYATKIIHESRPTHPTLTSRSRRWSLKQEIESTFLNSLDYSRVEVAAKARQWPTKLENKSTLFMNNPDKKWIIHELRLPQMRGAVDEAVVLSTANPL